MNTLLDILSIDNTAEIAALEAQIAAEEVAAVAAPQEETESVPEDVAEVAAVAEVAPAICIEGDFKEMIEAIELETVDAYLARLEAQFAERKDFEWKNAGTPRKFELLKQYSTKLKNSAIAKVMIATEAPASFINEQRGSKRFNIYAVDKLCDLTATLAGASVRNKVNNAVMRSMFACRREGIEFSGVVAEAAVSDKVRISEKLKSVLIRHTVSESTVSTQLSSTISAMRVLGLVEVVGTRQTPIYRLTDSPQTRYMEERLAA